MDEIKITKAMERIESLFYETKGKCYVSFSGGKDSTVILALIKLCEQIYTIPKNAIPAVFSNTGIELGATVDFIRWVKENWYENVQIIRPEKTFHWIINNKGKPMKSKMKSEFIKRYQNSKDETTLSFQYLVGNSGKNYAKTKLADKDMHMIHPDFDIKVSSECCKILKKKPFEIYNKLNDIKGYMLGERMSEGGVRQMVAEKIIENGGKPCTRTKGDYTVKLPIIDWTDKDIDEFIKEYNVPLSKAYTEQGYERTGCFMCPFSLQIDNNLQKLYEYEPNRYKASMVWMKDVFIAQNVILPFDEEYERQRKDKWNQEYDQMRYEMLLKYRPEKASKVEAKQMSLFDYWYIKDMEVIGNIHDNPELLKGEEK